MHNIQYNNRLTQITCTVTAPFLDLQSLVREAQDVLESDPTGGGLTALTQRRERGKREKEEGREREKPGRLDPQNVRDV